MNVNISLRDSCLRLKLFQLKQLKDGWMPGIYHSATVPFFETKIMITEGKSSIMYWQKKLFRSLFVFYFIFNSEYIEKLLMLSYYDNSFQMEN